MNRRKFVFWASAGLFSLGEMLRIEALDRAAAAMYRGGGSGGKSTAPTGKTVGLPPPKPKYHGGNYGHYNVVPSGPVVDTDVDDPNRLGQSEPRRLARQGRPPSHWIRSLDADELRVWLKSINPPASGVTGMSFATHLTRDHLFIPEKIAALTVNEQAKLHAAAHAGY